MSPIDIFLLAGLAAWSAASLCYALRVPRIFPVLKRWNLVTAYVQWSMFNAQTTSAEPSTTRLAIEYRDRDAAGRTGEWQEVGVGFTCGWRGFFWMPQRRLALRLRAVVAEVKEAADCGAAAPAELTRAINRLGACLRVMRPISAGARREIRVVERGVSGTGAPRERMLAQHSHDA